MTLSEKLQERLGGYPRLLKDTGNDAVLSTELEFIFAAREAEEALVVAQK